MAHNPEVEGSNPSPATKARGPFSNRERAFCMRSVNRVCKRLARSGCLATTRESCRGLVLACWAGDLDRGQRPADPATQDSASGQHPAELSLVVLTIKAAPAAPLARRQRRALPTRGPPGLRRVTYRQDRLINGSLSAAGPPRRPSCSVYQCPGTAAASRGPSASHAIASRPSTADRSQGSAPMRKTGADQDVASEEMRARLGARVAVTLPPGRGRRG